MSQKGKILLLPWRRYSDFFDKGTWGIWGLSSLLKFSLLYFALVFVPIIIPDSFLIYISGVVILGIVWALYLPFFFFILIKRLHKRASSTLLAVIKFWKSEEYIEDQSEIDFKTRLSWFWFRFGGINFYLFQFLTQFFPFSLLYKGRVFHAKNRHLLPLIGDIEAISKKAKLPIGIIGADSDIERTNFIAFPANDWNLSRLQKLEKVLQAKYDTIYVRSYDENQYLLLINFPSNSS